MENEVIKFNLEDGSYYEVIFVPSEKHLTIRKSSSRGDDTIIIKPITSNKIRVE